MFNIAIFVILILIFVAYNYPKTTIFLVLILGFLPRLFLFTKFLDFVNELQRVGGGFRAIDIVLVAMVGAVFIKLINAAVVRKNTFADENGISLLITIFSLLILFEIVRNIPKYGISAPGEFRFRYLILILPIYIVMFVNKEKDILKLIKGVLYVSVILPVIFIPFVLLNHRSEAGHLFRIFGSAVNLGFLLAIIIVFLLKNIKQFKIGKYFYLFLIVISIILITDTHRSVWISAIVAMFILLKYNYIKPNKLVVLSIVAIIIFYFSLFFIKDVGIRNPIAYLSTRASDIYTATQGYENTGYWRLIIWRASLLNTFKRNMLLGQGFGGYWDMYVPELKSVISVFPHSLYVMTFVKLGLIGFILYLGIQYKLFKKFNNKFKYFNRISNNSFFSRIAFMGLIILVVQHTYYLFYSFSYLPLIYLGLIYSYIKSRNNKEYALYNNPRP